MNASSLAGRRLLRAVLPLGAAISVTGCCCGVVDVVEETGPAVCRPPFVTPAPVTAADPLFTLLDAPVLSAEQERVLASARSSIVAAEVRVGRLADDARALLTGGRPILFTVSPSRSFSVSPVRVDSVSGPLSWSGQINGDVGEAYLLLGGEGVMGSLQSISTRETYEFRPIGGGLHAITCVDPSKYPPD